MSLCLKQEKLRRMLSENKLNSCFLENVWKLSRFLLKTIKTNLMQKENDDYFSDPIVFIQNLDGFYRKQDKNIEW